MMRSGLKLNRFLVFYRGTAIYDEKFHSGINVIRGEHSVGKSSLFDLIYYVLGGELKLEEWKYPTNECSEVRAEIEVNGKTITLARDISLKGKPNIKIYDGEYAKAATDSENWLSFGPMRSKNIASFSEMMFDLLGWGQQKTESYNSLTMHQVLRLSYLSQSSKSTNIFREEIDARGDSGSTRKAIAEFLLGLDDLTSYDKRQQKLAKEIELIKRQSKLDSIKNIIGAESATTVSEIHSLIDKKRLIIRVLFQEKDEKIGKTSGISSSAISDKRSEIINNIQECSEQVSTINNQISYNNRELDDCQLFATSLDYRIKSLGESSETYKALGSVSFIYCPACFSEIDEQIIIGECALCKNSITGSNLSEKYTETLADLKYQQKQNNNVISMLERELLVNRTKLSEINESLVVLQNELRSISSHSDERELLIEEYARKIATIESEIIKLNEKIPLIQELDDCERLIVSLTGEIKSLEFEIERLSSANKARNESVLSWLGESAAKFLEKGTGNEASFVNASTNTKEIDFEKDRWLLGGRVSFSESSNAEKKSALHLSFLLQALQDPKTRYPLFSIMDFEVSDLNENRSQTIQRNIMDALKDYDDYQLLITSSKICEELNNEKYGVGRYYGKNDYIFKLP
jgi:hypothetical protein